MRRLNRARAQVENLTRQALEWSDNHRGEYTDDDLGHVRGLVAALFHARQKGLRLADAVPKLFSDPRWQHRTTAYLAPLRAAFVDSAQFIRALAAIGGPPYPPSLFDHQEEEKRRGDRG